ncbi:FkbM family methyltransferase [Aquisphaera insulae]|uniref:FkbM family methyltransferase n=1 Tax=Aquisphaera insulae TaxID=2712864 RepID=UPI0013EC3826|nr:FkbM family methyltransferase [Aquisphaera insulae]
MEATEVVREVRTRGRRAVGRLARTLLPSWQVSLSHVEPGLRLRVDLKRNLMFWWGGLAHFERYSVSIARAAIRPGDTVIDVGANIGFFTTLFARLAGPGGQVVAFEPDPDNLALLLSNVGDLDPRDTRVEVIRAAVAAEPGTAHFSRDKATGATGHLGDDVTMGGSLYGDGTPLVEETPVETVDAVVQRLGLKPSFLKLDIEGGEFDALRGARETLAASHPVVVSELGGERGQDVLGLLSDAGYRLWNIETGQAVPDVDPDPAMVVAVHHLEIDDDRGRRILRALESLSE